MEGTLLGLVLLAQAAAGHNVERPAAPAKVVSKTVCAHGTHTVLELDVFERPGIGPPHSEEALIVRDAGRDAHRETPSGEPLHTEGFYGSQGQHLACLGFDAGAQRYLVGDQVQSGDRRELVGIWYLAEDGKVRVNSAFDRAGKDGLFALASLVSPLGRHVAFVGGHDRTVDGLYVLDTQRNEVHRLGDPPAPPPVGNTERQFGWGGCCDDGWLWRSMVEALSCSLRLHRPPT